MKKRILMTAGNLFPPKGGAEKSFFSFAKKMAQDYNLTIIAPADKDEKSAKENYTLIKVKTPPYIKFSKSYIKLNLQNIWWKKILKGELKQNKYDLLIHQGVLSQSTLGLKIKKINFIRGTGFLFSAAMSHNPEYYLKKSYFKDLSNLLKIQYPLVKYFQSRGLDTIRDSDIIVSNSKFMKDLVRKFTRKDSFVVYPPIDKKDYTSTGKPSKFKVVFIRPTLAKGVDMMLEIAKRMGNVQFLMVGKTDIEGQKYYNELSNLKNVKVLLEQKNMSKVYTKGRLLVSPTNWHEPFGRTPAEAGVVGMPSVVPSKGGIPEAVDNSGSVIVDFGNVDSWVREIEKYRNKKFYDKKSKKCFSRAKMFSTENQYKKLKRIIEAI